MGADHHHAPESDSGESQPVTSKYADIGQGSSHAFDFFSSVIAGMLLGFFLDWIFSTAPVFVIIGIVAGFVSGFVKLWAASQAIEDEARRRGRL